MVDFSKKHPGKVRAGTVGTGSVGHLNIEMINSLTGAGVTMVPFKGGAPGITALLGGHVEGGAFSLGALSSHLKSGAMRGMVVSNSFPGILGDSDADPARATDRTSSACGSPSSRRRACRLK